MLLVEKGESAQPVDTQTASAAVKVITQTVAMTPNDRVFEAVGTGRARLSVQVYPAVSEEVTDVLFEPQQVVAKGDVLVQLDDREQKAERVFARVVARKAGLVLLDGDIAAGKDVVVEGLQRLRPGADVQMLGTSGQ